MSNTTEAPCADCDDELDFGIYLVYVVYAMIAGFCLFNCAKTCFEICNSKQRYMNEHSGLLALTPVVAFNSITAPMNDSCVICIEDFQGDDTARKLACSHIFHKDCIDPWLTTKGCCPICKNVVLNQNT